MATSADEQKMWVHQLSKKVSRKGIGQPVTSAAGGDRSAPGYVSFCIDTCTLFQWMRVGFSDKVVKACMCLKAVFATECETAGGI